MPLETDDAVMRPIHGAIRNVWRISAGFSFLITGGIFAAISFAISKGLEVSYIWILLPALALALLMTGRMIVFADREWKAWRYGITEEELIMSWGVFWRTFRVVPRVAIQHIDINQGPLDRHFGLVQVVVYTAGSASAVAAIPGLTQREAEELRAYLASTAVEAQ
jgi:membrane protein YdbS with pleckstrin-like domain